MLNSLQAFYTIGTLCIITGAIWKFFDEIEKVASDEARTSTGAWLRRASLKNKYLKSWPETFISIFDKIFGKKLLSWGSYSRSILASLSLSFFTFLILGFPIEGGKIPWKLLGEALPQIFLMTLVNIHTDYLSLLESRFILGMTAKTKSQIKVIGLLFLDFILSNLIFVITLLGYFGIAYIDSHIISLYQYSQDTTGIGVVGDDLTIVFYVSTFFTSLWIWLYVASGVIIRFITSFDAGFIFLKRILDIEKKPFKSIGVFTILILIIAFLITWIVAKIFHII